MLTTRAVGQRLLPILIVGGVLATNLMGKAEQAKVNATKVQIEQLGQEIVGRLDSELLARGDQLLLKTNDPLGH